MRRSFACLALFLLAAPLMFGQCRSGLWTSTLDSKVPDELQSLLPAGMAGRFAVSLNSSDWLVVYAKPGARTPDDPQDGGFLLVRGRRVLVNQSLMKIPAWKKFARDIGPDSVPTFRVFATQVCRKEKRTLFLGFAACCTTASAVQYILVQPDSNGYRLTMLPMVGGGKLQIMDGHSIRLKLWSETGDGSCDGCLQHFDISEYAMQNGEPVLVRKERALGKYKPGDFNAHRIVLVTG